MISTKNLKKEKKKKESETIKLIIKDEYFKMLFANQKHLETLTFLVSRILEQEYQDVEGKISLSPLNQPKEEKNKIDEERDIVVSIANNIPTKLILEANYDESLFHYKKDYFLDNRETWITKFNRDIYYTLGIYYNSLANASDYDKLPKIILVDFNPYFLDMEKNFIEKCFFKTGSGHIVTDKLQIININIVNCYNLWYNGNYKSNKYNKYEQDIIILGAMLATSKDAEIEACLKDLNTSPKIKKIFKGVITKMDKNEEALGRLYNPLEEQKRIYDGAINLAERRGIEKGTRKGIEQNKREIVINMLNNNFEIDTISKITELSPVKVKTIIENYQKQK